MGNNSTSLATLVLIATMNSSTVCLSIDSNVLPSCNSTYTHTQDIANWREQALSDQSNALPYDGDNAKLDIILSFSKRIIEDSKDIDIEFVEIVNKKFWDII